MEEKWYILNEKIFEMENRREDSEEFKKEWNDLIDRSRKIGLCVKRDKYEENKPEKNARTRGGKKKKKRGEGTDVESISGGLGGETTQE